MSKLIDVQLDLRQPFNPLVSSCEIVAEDIASILAIEYLLPIISLW